MTVTCHTQKCEMLNTFFYDCNCVVQEMPDMQTANGGHKGREADRNGESMGEGAN